MKNTKYFILILFSFSFSFSANSQDLVRKNERILTDEMLKCAWSAMDQTYFSDVNKNSLAKGERLYSPDNLSSERKPARKIPWNVSNDFVVKVDTGLNHTGGRAIIYENRKSSAIMISMMGTNGEDDARGWEENFRDMALLQFIKYGDAGPVRALFSLERIVMDEVRAMTKIDRRNGIIPIIIFVGDSKGGAQAQALMASYLRYRDDFKNVMAEINLNYDPSEYVPNEKLALVAHSAPGAVDAIKVKGYDTSVERYSGIEMHYSFAYNKYYPEFVSTLGEYLGVGKENPDAEVVKYKTHYMSVKDMHRLVVSGYTYFENGGDFMKMEHTKKPIWLRKTQGLSDTLNAIKEVLGGKSIKD